MATNELGTSISSWKSEAAREKRWRGIEGMRHVRLEDRKEMGVEE